MTGSGTLSWAPANYWMPPRQYRAVLGQPLYWQPPRVYRATLGAPPTYWSRPTFLGQITTASIQAQIQAELGEFLQARQQLDQMLRKAKTAQDLQAVQILQLEQTDLENELPGALATAKAIKEGQFNLTLGAQLTGFAYRLHDHMQRVRSLRSKLGVGPAVAAGGFGVGTIAIVGLALGGLMIAGMTMRRR